MLASMPDALRTKLEGKETALEILDVLQEMFSKQREQARIELTHKYSSTKNALWDSGERSCHDND